MGHRRGLLFVALLLSACSIFVSATPAAAASAGDLDALFGDEGATAVDIGEDAIGID